MTAIRDFLKILRYRLGAGNRAYRRVSPTHPDGSLRHARREAEPVLMLQDAIQTEFTKPHGP